MLPRAALLVALLSLARPAGAQAPREPSPYQRCAALPDSVPGPTPGQIRERLALRDTIVAIARRAGVAEPTGLLLLDINELHQGQVLFLESNLPEAAVARATRRVSEYLESLVPGRAYQALVRIDGDYPAMSPGRTHCPPVMIAESLQRVLIDEIVLAHPEKGRHPRGATRRVMMRVVVSRDGTVPYVNLTGSSGDAYLDDAAQQIAYRLRFAPGLLDGIPFDARFRYPMTFVVP